MRTIPAFCSFVVVFLFALTYQSLAEPVFPKGAEVRLTKDALLLFKNQKTRTGNACERFTVIQHDTKLQARLYSRR